MVFHSILFEKPEDGPRGGDVPEPDFFADLNLDQIISAVTIGWDDYNLKPFFYTELSREAAITYRHEVMQDLDDADVLDSINAFAQGMRKMREHLAQAEKLRYRLQKEWWFLEAIVVYCETLVAFARDLPLAAPTSKGLGAFHQYLTGYVVSERFQSLTHDAEHIKRRLSAIRYCVLIKGNAVTVRHYDAEIDYSADVLRIFERFKQGAVKDHRVELRDWLDMNHVEAHVLDFVAQLHPREFLELTTYSANNASYLDATIRTFDREVQFYLAFRGYISICKAANLCFCYPRVSSSNKAVRCDETFDLALAHKLTSENAGVVQNDFHLDDEERLIVVSGPNNGGKTTFARTFGQLHYLARIGCPVPGRNATLFLYDRLFTHFEREENTKDLRGKLQDDLMRVHHIMTHATSRSVIIMNEIFSSTTLTDALFLSRKIIGEILERDLLCVCVTFIDELAHLGEQVVSMVSEIKPGDPASRTYRVRRKPADGRAYAVSVAEHYGLTYDRLKERLGL
ncbi:DNA mismatch repair protein MutS [Paraburkholderia sp. RP-4-7]|uniref:DNA mismatch repair protein MutS n=1 Tax=Paraburkholderia polaris TaxID=2728848 RepID=A0A848I1W3_9BURK|nr:DNA mismatch repair protein MutS [Paraburkholderia polaris]NML96371.1 DNA mismatch repair protein MutS [Paraburkholderia polaris]